MSTSVGMVVDVDAGGDVQEVVREQVTVHQPAQVAWDHLARLAAWPSWAGHILAMDPEPPGRLTASTEVVLHMRAGPRARMTVTHHDPPRRWVWEGDSPGVTTVFEHRFEEVPGGTRIWFLSWMRGPLAGIVGPVFGAVMHRHLTRALPRLRAEIDDAPTSP